jgi:hypothetical protein
MTDTVRSCAYLLRGSDREAFKPYLLDFGDNPFFGFKGDFCFRVGLRRGDFRLEHSGSGEGDTSKL